MERERQEQSIQELVDGGENHFVEFKSSAFWSLHLSPDELAKVSSSEARQYGRCMSLIIIAKTVASMLNSDGGNLIIGLKEMKDAGPDKIIGIEPEFKKLKDPCIDGYRRMLLDKIIKPYFPSRIFNHLNTYIKINFEKFDNKILCWLRIKKSDQKVFLKINQKDLFFIRVDATTRQIYGEEIVDYCLNRFSDIAHDKELSKFFEEDFAEDKLIDERKHHITRDTVKLATVASGVTSQAPSFAIGLFNYKKYAPQVNPSKERQSNYHSMPARLSTDDKGNVLNPFSKNSKRFICFEALRRNVSFRLLCEECNFNEENRVLIERTYRQIKKCYFPSL